uniref:Saposin B-type domain-containing protein n=1 Tax=Rhabditophanes sp. KR3021 TaxID=114890 RepID=A0AC35U0Z4_9BILA
MKFITVLLSLLFVASVVSAGQLCQLCISFVGGIEQGIESDEPDIVKYGDDLCNELTGNSALLDPVCKQLVQTEMDKIVAALKNGQDAKSICADIDFC